MKASKWPVSVEIVSRTGEETIRSFVSGELYVNERIVYLKYDEPEPSLGGTRTLVKANVAAAELKVMRHGDLELEQTFRVGETWIGRYGIPQGTLQLETKTNNMHIDLTAWLPVGQNPGSHERAEAVRSSASRMDRQIGKAARIGSVAWDYELWIGDDYAGHFMLTLNIREEA